MWGVSFHTHHFIEVSLAVLLASMLCSTVQVFTQSCHSTWRDKYSISTQIVHEIKRLVYLCVLIYSGIIEVQDPWKFFRP